MSARPDHSAVIWGIAIEAARARCRDILAVITDAVGYVVQAGLFAGMTLPARAAWGDGDALPKLLGCYESELHAAIAAAVAAGADLVVNIGAAEGYYTVGLARLLPGTRVLAFDSNDQAQGVCREAARLNGVERWVAVAGTCSAALLRSMVANARAPMVICDCEGAEINLIDPAQMPALANATLIVECHDFLNAAITPTLTQRLEPTHDVHLVRESGRDPSGSPLLQRLNSLDRWLAVCEFRPTTMHWLIATPRSR